MVDFKKLHNAHITFYHIQSDQQLTAAALFSNYYIHKVNI